MAKQAHILFVPFPAQGHVKPLLKLAYKVASHGMKVTFVDTGSLHSKPFATKSDKIQEHNKVVFVSVSLGLHASNDQSHVENSMERGDQAGNVMELIRNISSSGSSSEVTCVIADSSMGWILAELEQNLRIQTVSFSPISMGSLALACHIPKLIEAATINKDGKIVDSDGVISLSVDIPTWKATELTWIYPRNEETEKFIFEMLKTTQKTVECVEWTVCNSCFEFEPAACDLIPRSLPIGPLIETGDVERASGAAGSFWLEDTICLDWLDTKPHKCVIYVAFGSIANLDQHEFDELALGLEISGHPFLWVVRSDFIGITLPDYPIGFMERVANQGKIVEWAPQEKFLDTLQLHVS